MREQINNGTVVEVHDTEGAEMSQGVTQGVVGETHVKRGNAMAREYATDVKGSELYLMLRSNPWSTFWQAIPVVSVANA